MYRWVDNYDNVSVLLAFVEFLHVNHLSVRVISNYLLAIKQKMKLYGAVVDQFESQWLKSYLKSVEVNGLKRISDKQIFTIQQIRQLSEACIHFSHPMLYRAAILLGFFGMLRIYNVTPQSAMGFDCYKHLLVKDFKYTPQGAVLSIRWAKNMQALHHSHFVHLPSLNDQMLCPVWAVRQLVEVNHSAPSQPLLSIGRVILTEPMLRKQFNYLRKVVGLTHPTLTFHALRRTAASILFNKDVNFETIKRHGAWKSNAVYQYLVASSHQPTSIPAAFKTIID